MGVRLLLVVLLVLLPGCRSTPTRPSIDLKTEERSAAFFPFFNLPWFQYRRDFGKVNAWEHVGASSAAPAMAKSFAALHQAGVKGVVWFLLADGGAAPNFDSEGRILGLDPLFLADLKAALAIAEENQISVVWVLMDHLWMKPAELSGATQLFGHSRLIEDASQQQLFLDKVLEPILVVASNSRSTAGWIVMNEPEIALNEGWVNEQQLFPFLNAVASRIRQNRATAAISIGHADIESLIDFTNNYPEAPISFLSFHHYRNYMPPAVARIRRTIGDSRKPIYVGEFNWNELSLPHMELDLQSIIAGSYQLGYAGIWPWSLNPKEGTAPASINVKEYAALVRESEKFPEVPNLSEKAAEGALTQVDAWRLELELHRSQIAENTQKLIETKRLLAQIEPELAKRSVELEKAQSANQQLVAALTESRSKIAWMRWLPWASQDLALEQANEKQLQARMDVSKNGVTWMDEANANFKKSDAELKAQQNWKKLYEMRIRGNQFQLAAKQRHRKLTRQLYNLP